MSLLRRVRGEVAGAWRSVGYDLGRRPARPADGPDVTSTGMGTFPGSLVDPPGSRPETDARPPRRFVAISAFCALALLGAGGSYLAATRVFAQEPPTAPADRPAAAPPPAPAEFGAPDSAGLGPGPVATGRPRTTSPVPPGTPAAQAAQAAAPGAGGAATTVVRPDGTVVVTTAPREAVTRPGRPVTRPVTGSSDPECHCTPPVPTPTVPSATAAPSASTSPSPTATTGSPSVDPGTSSGPDPSATPSGSAEPSPDRPRRWRDSDHRHRHRHHH